VSPARGGAKDGLARSVRKAQAPPHRSYPPLAPFPHPSRQWMGGKGVRSEGGVFLISSYRINVKKIARRVARARSAR